MKPIPRRILLALALATMIGPLQAQAPDSSMQDARSSIDTIAPQMAAQMEAAPAEHEQQFRDGYAQMVDDLAFQLEATADASDEQLAEFREEAVDVGREHGLVDD